MLQSSEDDGLLVGTLYHDRDTVIACSTDYIPRPLNDPVLCWLERSSSVKGQSGPDGDLPVCHDVSQSTASRRLHMCQYRSRPMGITSHDGPLLIHFHIQTREI